MITFNIIIPPNFVVDIGPNLQQLGAKIVVSAVTPMIDALDGIKDAIVIKEEALAGFKALQARFDALDNPKP